MKIAAQKGGIMELTGGEDCSLKNGATHFVKALKGNALASTREKDDGTLF